MRKPSELRDIVENGLSAGGTYGTASEALDELVELAEREARLPSWNDLLQWATQEFGSGPMVDLHRDLLRSYNWLTARMSPVANNATTERPDLPSVGGGGFPRGKPLPYPDDDERPEVLEE